jgi:gas vesicle protein
MYYVIKKRRDKPGSTFVGFLAPKFIATKNSESVIFEFEKDGKVIRKWIKKEDLILLTADKEYFQTIMRQFKEVQQAQQAIVDEASKALEKSMEDFMETMNSEISDYEELRDASDVPCIIKGL